MSIIGIGIYRFLYINKIRLIAHILNLIKNFKKSTNRLTNKNIFLKLYMKNGAVVQRENASFATRRSAVQIRSAPKF